MVHNRLFNSRSYAISLTFNILSEKNFESVDVEDATVADAAHLAGREDFDIAPTAIEVIAERDNVVKLQD